MERNGMSGHALAAKIHGPFITKLSDTTGYDTLDATPSADIAGLRFVGRLPHSARDIKDVKGIA